VPTVASEATVALVYIEPISQSYVETLPNKLFEAVQARLPVVATDLPQIRTIVDHYEIGELVPAGDADSLGAAIERILSAPDSYRSRLEVAAHELSWEEEQKVLLEAYRAVR
jgi:glycosyltransferase involved in cell wall biosynthesis